MCSLQSDTHKLSSNQPENLEPTFKLAVRRQHRAANARLSTSVNDAQITARASTEPIIAFVPIAIASARHASWSANGARSWRRSRFDRRRQPTKPPARVGGSRGRPVSSYVQYAAILSAIDAGVVTKTYVLQKLMYVFPGRSSLKNTHTRSLTHKHTH
jgi:hypothetical protein